MQNQSDIRPSPIAGKWYPADPQRLSKQVDDYLQAADLPPLEGSVIAVVAPHAGYVYSGSVAGHAFAALSGLQPKLVVVVSPMHHPYPDPLLSSAHQAYYTPLGTIPIDHQALDRLSRKLYALLGFGITKIRRDPEHSLEIELPFLQRALSAPFSLLPVMVRDQSHRVAKALGDALVETIGDQAVVLVASTDLSHFYNQKTAEKLDSTVLKEIENFNPSGVLQVEAEGRGFACGHGALAAVLWAARNLGADGVKILSYATSGDVSGDFQQVVGYGSAAVTRSISN